MQWRPNHEEKDSQVKDKKKATEVNGNLGGHLRMILKDMRY